ncbi:hypothetical protein TUE45_04363 [Streptomyces reticuli]|nr:hypothetical protein TUE45_04363 [Streptomyces reticuli]
MTAVLLPTLAALAAAALTFAASLTPAGRDEDGEA